MHGGKRFSGAVSISRFSIAGKVSGAGYLLGLSGISLQISSIDGFEESDEVSQVLRAWGWNERGRGARGPLAHLQSSACVDRIKPFPPPGLQYMIRFASGRVTYSTAWCCILVNRHQTQDYKQEDPASHFRGGKPEDRHYSIVEQHLIHSNIWR